MIPIFKIVVVPASKHQESIPWRWRLTHYLWGRIFTAWILDLDLAILPFWTTSRQGCGWILFLVPILLQALFERIPVYVSKADGYGTRKVPVAPHLST